MVTSSSVRSVGWTQRTVASSILLALDLSRREAGQRVVKLREARGWSQEDLAHAADVSVKTVSRLENGHKESRTGTLEAIAKALDVSRDDILPRPAPLGLGLDDRHGGVEQVLTQLDATRTELEGQIAEMRTELGELADLIRRNASEDS